MSALAQKDEDEDEDEDDYVNTPQSEILTNNLRYNNEAMDTSTSPKAPQESQASQAQPSKDTRMQIDTEDPIPLTSPLRTHHKRGLPPTLASTYPHGHISGHARSSAQQQAFEARKEEILKTMSTADIEKRYEEKVKEIRGVLEETERKTKEVEGEMEKLRMDREMERRVWGKLRRMKEGGG